MHKTGTTMLLEAAESSFQGANPRGVTVRVLADALDEARTILRPAD